VAIQLISGTNLPHCFNLMFVTEEYEVDYRQMTGSSVYSKEWILLAYIQKSKLRYSLRRSIPRDRVTKLAQNRVHWRALVLRVLKFRVLLRRSYWISNTDFIEVCLQDGRWMELAQDRLQWWDLALTLILLTWKIWWVPKNVSRWQMGFNSAFKVLKVLNLPVLLQKLWFVS
jgi:hypothetical protein